MAGHIGWLVGGVVWALIISQLFPLQTDTSIWTVVRCGVDLLITALRAHFSPGPRVVIDC